MHDGRKLRSFNVKSYFTFFINHFTAVLNLSPVNWWNFFVNCLEAISLCSQYRISNIRNGFFTADIFGGIINDSSSSKGVIKCHTKDHTYNNLKGLIKDKNLCVLSGDKDSCVIIMNKQDYIQKLQDMINEGIKRGTWVVNWFDKAGFGNFSKLPILKLQKSP